MRISGWRIRLEESIRERRWGEAWVYDSLLAQKIQRGHRTKVLKSSMDRAKKTPFTFINLISVDKIIGVGSEFTRAHWNSLKKHFGLEVSYTTSSGNVNISGRANSNVSTFVKNAIKHYP